MFTAFRFPKVHYELLGLLGVEDQVVVVSTPQVQYLLPVGRLIVVAVVGGGCTVGFAIYNGLYALLRALWVSAVVKVFLNLEFGFIFG